MQITLQNKINSKHVSIIISFVLNLIVYLLSLCVSPHFETNDDLIMSSLLYGTSGSVGTSYLVFSSRVWGIVLLFFSSLFKSINVYFIAQIIVCFLSSLVITEVLIDKYSNKDVIILLIVWFSAVFEVYHYTQFTKTAGLASIAGMLGVLFFTGKTKRLGMLILSSSLIVLGFNIRSSSMYLGVLSMGSVCLFFLLHDFESFKKKLPKYVIVFGSVLLIICFCLLIDYCFNSSNEQIKSFQTFNELRAKLNDNYFNRTSMNEELKNAVLDLETQNPVMFSNFRMVGAWMSNDPQTITIDSLKELSDFVDLYNHCSVSDMIHIYLFNYIPILFSSEPLFFAAVFLCITNLFFSKNRLYSFFSIVITIISQCYLVFQGRYGVHRVDYVILLALIVSQLYLFEYAKISNSFKRLFLLSGIIFAEIIIGCCGFALYKSISTTVSDINNMRICNQKIQDIIQSDEKYMIHSFVPSYADTERSIYLAPQKDVFSDDFFIGGWTSGELFGDVINCNIDGNPWVQCVDSDDIKFLLPTDKGDYLMGVIRSHIELHYGIKTYSVLERSNDYYSVYSLKT